MYSPVVKPDKQNSARLRGLRVATGRHAAHGSHASHAACAHHWPSRGAAHRTWEKREREQDEHPFFRMRSQDYSRHGDECLPHAGRLLVRHGASIVPAQGMVMMVMVDGKKGRKEGRKEGELATRHQDAKGRRKEHR
jgi:hypothetical protein